MAETPQYQILVRFLDGRTRCLRFSTPTISGASLLDAVSFLSRVPTASLRLVTGRLDVSPSLVLASAPDGQFPSASALLRLRGGKGGFGSLLRGAASKAGQKKTSNFDACRDINGRRLRHVNAERRLEEWKAEAGDRQLEKLAEDFIKKKKKAKEAGRRGGPSEAEVNKYLEKYRKDAAICVNAVEESVRASLGKRKTGTKPPAGSDSKKLKIWLGKKKVEGEKSDSDSDVDDEDSDADEGAVTRSVVLDDGNCSNGSSKSELDIGSASGSHSEGESSGEKSRLSDSDENGNSVQETMELMAGAEAEGGKFESDSSMEPEGGMMEPPTSVNGTVVTLEEHPKSDEVIENVDNTASATSNQNNPEVPQVEESDDGNESTHSEPLNLAEYSSAAELEALGLDKLKLELQSRGLKCGGTLQERAARLFLLKTTPLDKLPKKLLAKPGAGGK